MRNGRLVLLLIALTALLAAPALAQTYRLYGYVIDTSEVVVPGATVKVMKNGEVVATVVTDDYGRFSILVEPGTYTIVAEKTGYRTAQEVVEVKNHTSVTLVLTPIISVEPVKKVFGPGDWLELKITGPADAAVTIVVTNPKGINIFDQAILPHNGSAIVKMFRFPEKATQYCPEGEYKVKVTYNGISATAEFKFSLTAPKPVTVERSLPDEPVNKGEEFEVTLTAEATVQVSDITIYEIVPPGVKVVDPGDAVLVKEVGFGEALQLIPESARKYATEIAGPQEGVTFLVFKGLGPHTYKVVVSEGWNVKKFSGVFQALTSEGAVCGKVEGDQAVEVVAPAFIELSPEAITGKEGLPFRVTAELQGPSVEAWKVVLELSFDPNAMDLAKVVARPPLKATVEEVEPGKVKVIVEGALKGGVVALMDFKVKVGAELGNYTIKLLSAEVYDKEGNAITVSIRRSEVKVFVKKGLAGDVTGDEKVDYKDLAVLAACFGAKKGTAKYKMDLDLNGDGVIDYRDLAIFAAVYGLRRGKP